MILNKFLALYIVSLILGCVGVLSTSPPGLESCNGKRNCSECIQTFGCRWCKEIGENHEKDDKRCFSGNSTSCSPGLIEDPKSFEIPMDTNSSVASSMRPSAYKISLRVGETKNVSVTYTDEANRPLDLYILMDLSCTMKKEKEKVVNLARGLAESLGNLTRDLAMGFGSFVDKPVGPFMALKDTEKSKCNNVTIDEKTHVFKNHMSMTKDVETFIKSVARSGISSNLDIPEGGLDALMQAITCTTITEGTKGVGWRSVESKTRKLIVVSTDGPFHIAGDGRLGGVVLPNDGKCHVDSDGYYTKGLEMDYPSVSQVRDTIRENSVFVVFAVTLSQKATYEKLVNAIGTEFASVQTIDDNKSTVEVIKSEYQKVVKQVSFLPVVNDYVDVVYFVKCPLNHTFVEGHECSNLSPKAEVEIKVQVTLKKCPTSKSRLTAIQVSPSDSKGDHNAFRINLQMLCDCGCESVGNNTPPNSIDRCSNQGYLQCGICKCNDKYGGPKCGCPLEEGESTVTQESCRDSSGQICSNQGKCECGMCKCNPGRGGNLCQCKNNDCLFRKDEDKGFCNSELGQGSCGVEVCKQCKCSDNFHGDRCECPTDQKGCKTDGETCSGKGRGECTCNKCMCDKDYHGQYCELQYSKDSQKGECNDALIHNVKSCVECLHIGNAGVVDKSRLLQSGQGCHQSCNQAKAEVTMVDAITTGIANNETDEWCQGTVTNKDKCDIVFQVGSWIVKSGKVKVQIEKNPRQETCVAEIPLLPIILTLVGIILLVGVVLLVIWKILTYIHDKNEFSKFENETQGASWNLDENPLYKGTVSEFQNPAYSTHVENDKNK